MEDFTFMGTSGMGDLPKEDATDPTLFRDFVNGSRVYICERMKLDLLWPHLKQGGVIDQRDQELIELNGRTSWGQNDYFLDLMINHRRDDDFLCLFRALRDRIQGDIVDTIFIEGHTRKSNSFASWLPLGADGGSSPGRLVADGPVMDASPQRSRDAPASQPPPSQQELLDILQPVDDCDVDVEGVEDAGYPVTVLAGDDGNFRLDEGALRRILLRPEVRDRQVALISVAGAFRKGKSFLLDFFLRYFNAEGRSDWMGDELAPLEGFTWRGGEDRETSGMILWSKPFIVKQPDGQEIAVLLMDTQGVFDTETTQKECAIMFGLSIMLSSCTIYNLFTNIQEDDLQHLQFFTEYGRLAMKSRSDKPFQFLVRDYTFGGFGKPLGAEGGQDLLDKRLATSERQPAELRELREYLKSCFSRLQGFLLPRPGDATESPEYNGNLAGLRQDFRSNLADLVQSLAAPGNIVPKEINGQRVTCGELYLYFKAYVEMFRGEDIPEAISLYQATIAASLTIASKKATDNYRENINKVLDSQTDPLHPDLFNGKHEECRELALSVFSSAHNVATREDATIATERLESAMMEIFEPLHQNNGTKYGIYMRDQALEHYRIQMNQICSSDVGVEVTVLNDAHEEAKRSSLEMLQNCNCEFTNPNDLHEWIAQTYKSFKYENEVKLQKVALQKSQQEKEEADQRAEEAKQELERRREKSPDTVQRVSKELARAEKRIRDRSPDFFQKVSRELARFDRRVLRRKKSSD